LRVAIAQKWSVKSEDELKANAELIAEVGSVANQTGLTPRELLAQRNELLKALMELSEAVKPHVFKLGVRHGFHEIVVLNAADKLIHEITA